MLFLPLIIVGGLRQLAGMAQLIKNLAVIDTARKLGVVERPHLLKGAVVIDQVLAGTENGDSSLDLVKGALVRFNLLFQI